jgi:D-tagatose-1,6-bisphosphate aldolase subunit GatZ/KbaZ
MYLDDVRSRQVRGEAAGMASVCSAHPAVIRETLRLAHRVGVPALIESTCNQVNQFGGYTGTNPATFAASVRALADEMDLSFDSLLLGGDHLGPSVWQHEPARSALQKASDLVRDYVQGGFVKLHLDCSMRLADDPPEGPQPEIVATRAAQLAAVAERSNGGGLRYVIGTEVPLPGGATRHEKGSHTTRVEDASSAIELHHLAFRKQGLEAAWDRVVAVVVQPGVEFGDDFVAEYQPAQAGDLSRFIETQALVYEAHSTDYQTRAALQQLVHDHFAILKVGPALTFAYREAVFALAMIEDELFPPGESSNLIGVIDQAMLHHPGHWEKYYAGSPAEQAFKRRFSLSDRIRYYWPQPKVQSALQHLFSNLHAREIPASLMSQYLPLEQDALLAHGFAFSPEAVISERITRRLGDYFAACYPEA